MEPFIGLLSIEVVRTSSVVSIFGSERFRVVPEPYEFGVHKKGFPNHICLGVRRDSLSIFDFSSLLCVEIWIMRDYGIKESWSKGFVIENAIDKRGQLDYCEPIMILKGGEILMLVNKSALVQYIPKVGSFKKLNIYGIKSEFYATSHVPSFVSLADVSKGELTVHISFLFPSFVKVVHHSDFH